MSPRSTDYALLSQDVYHDTAKNETVTLDGITYRVLDTANNANTGFQAQAYVREDVQPQQVIIAYRGTEFDREPVHDGGVDATMVIAGVNLQTADATAFTEKVIAETNQLAKDQGRTPPDITVTGHSLGGTLAEINASKYGLRGETFNAYGAAGLRDGVPEGGSQVIDHVRAGDVVSAASPHFGEVRVYAAQKDVDTLTHAGYRDDSTILSPRNPIKAIDFDSHAIDNFVPNSKLLGESIINPENQARYKAHEGMIDRYRNDVADIRMGLSAAWEIPKAIGDLKDAVEHRAAEALGAGVVAVEHGVQYAVHEAKEGFDHLKAGVQRVGHDIADGVHAVEAKAQGAWNTLTHPGTWFEHDKPGVSLDHTAHPDHPLFKQAREAVHELDRAHGRHPDVASENVAGSLVVKARQEGLERIDKAVLSDDASRIYAVQGTADSPFEAHGRNADRTGRQYVGRRKQHAVAASRPTGAATGPGGQPNPPGKDTALARLVIPRSKGKGRQRMSKTRGYWAIGLFVVALVAGELLSGYLTLLFLRLGQIPLRLATYYEYVRALNLPQVRPFAWKIETAGVLGFAIPLILWFVVLYFLTKKKKQAIHGDARFAHGGDLRKQKMLSPAPNGILVGKYKGDLVRLPGQQFVILAAPTRSGKGVGVVIPNLLDYQESIVVLDIKQENFDLTSGWRKSQGQEIYLFNPFAEDRRTHRWNPLSYVSRDPAFRVSDLMSIASMLYPDGSDEQKFWVSQARNAFMAFSLYLCEKWEDDERKNRPMAVRSKPTLGMIYRLSSGDGTDLRELYTALSKESFLSANAQSAFANMLSQANETFASILGTFKEPLNAWINPVLDAATSEDDFLLTDVRKKRMTIYIGIQPNKLAESRLIVNLFFSQLINLNTKELPQNNPELKHQCLLLMDEFTSIGKVEIIASAVSYMAGYNIRLLPIIQSMAQLDATYGRDVSRTVITNHALQIVFAPREQQDANDYSDMLGYTTVRRENITKNKNGDVSRSHSEEKRALMLPQELKSMGTDKEVFLYEGIPHPVMCEKIRYYEDKYFTSRLMPKATVTPLTI